MLVFIAFILTVRLPHESASLHFKVLFVVPLFGTLVRFRADHTQRTNMRIGIDNEGKNGEVELCLRDVRIGTEGEERVCGYADLIR